MVTQARRRVARPPAAVVATLVAAAGLAGLWLLAPLMGTDLSAQIARADFFAAHGWAPLDLRWYGGVSPHGYSLLTPPLMAWFGPRPVGAGAVVVAAWALVSLFRRTGAARPLLGGVLGAACLVGNLVSGRVTFAVGVALGLCALLLLAAADHPSRDAPGLESQPPRPAEAAAPVGTGWDRDRWLRYAAVAALTALATAASPVAGLFLGLAGTALVLSAAGRALARRTGARRDPVPRGPVVGGAVLAVAAAVPMAVMAAGFGADGWMNISRADLIHATVTSLAVAVLVRPAALRAGALLSAGGVLAAYLLTTPVGLNATRLATMFALPVVAAYAMTPGWPWRTRLRTRALAGTWRRGWLAPVLVGLALWQPPVLVQDLTGAGGPETDPAFYAPLREELARRPPAGRVEVVPTAGYWEVAYLPSVPLARGWLRQADLARNPLFFDGSLDADSYRRWLHANAVSYVALPEAPVSWVGRREAELIRGGLPYLTVVWQHPDWTLYEVTGSPAMVSGPAQPRGGDGATVAFEATGPGEILLRVRWSRYLAVTGPAGACLAPAGEWTLVRVDRPGDYQVSSSLRSPGPRCE